MTKREEGKWRDLRSDSPSKVSVDRLVTLDSARWREGCALANIGQCSSAKVRAAKSQGTRSFPSSREIAGRCGRASACRKQVTVYCAKDAEHDFMRLAERSVPGDLDASWFEATTVRLKRGEFPALLVRAGGIGGCLVGANGFLPTPREGIVSSSPHVRWG